MKTVKDKTISEFLEENPEYTGTVVFDREKEEVDRYVYQDYGWGKQTVHFTEGVIYNEEGPSIEYENGAVIYTDSEGKKHRTDGPAQIDPNGKVKYFVNGDEVSKAGLDHLVTRHNKIASLFDDDDEE